HGLGNDFVLINGFTEQLPVDLSALAIEICDRHLSIGGDGLLILRPAVSGAAAEYILFNSDGSQPETCGNGLRCAALFAKREGIVSTNKFVFDTLGGSVIPQIIDAEKGMVCVDMGQPRLAPAQIPAKFTGARVVDAPLLILARMFNVTLVSMGNPHCVIFIDDDLTQFPVEKIGSLVEKHELFPARTNVEFIRLIDDKHMEMRVWERGCGETLACGSGACAAVVAAVLNGYTKNDVEVKLRHGSLQVQWNEGSSVFMTGSATYVLEGEYFLA
ncbi:MAG: diaminopimelate epimerase, partial [Clostridiales bacterium]|nr:diaminopimelate epimerase [Clostridiales bacterium]